MCLSPAESEMLSGSDSIQPNSSLQPRPLIVGPSTALEAPYPLQMEGKVIRGFGRGSSELGIPTANLPVDENLTPWIGDITSGVYFGWASLRLPSSHPNHPATSSDTTTTTTTTEFSVYPMVMSIGYNKFYNNKDRSAEVHVLHEFGAAFYGVEMRLLITGFIREERDYDEVQELIDDIKLDCVVTRNSLDREAWALRETGKGTLDGSWLVRETAEQNGDVV
ncbi:hypothetical protein B0H14DRAFT_2895241 [Mycena olivaceomarginata]|nr:hypothetical protein B0H14DRAFT_2895241 [Mycena olivaceomarginata]